MENKNGVKKGFIDRQYTDFGRMATVLPFVSDGKSLF
jgi:hypothetical protein